jgi:3-oxoacyl-[acyl-carrier protein] reductase
MGDVILVTGASSAVGQALLSRLATSGATAVYAHYATGGERLRAHLATLGGPVQFIPIEADFSSPSAVDSLIDTIRGAHGRPNKIVHACARRLRLERFAQIDLGRMQDDFDISVRSIATILRAFLPELAKEKDGPGGQIVFVLSSVTVGEPAKGMPTYTVVKYALLGLMRALAVEYADKRICVNAVSPYTMETPFLAEVPHKYAEISASKNPAGRNATPGDVAPVIEFLLSEGARFVTGVNVPVTAGAAF